jgi:hypothetical protein
MFWCHWSCVWEVRGSWDPRGVGVLVLSELEAGSCRREDWSQDLLAEVVAGSVGGAGRIRDLRNARVLVRGDVEAALWTGQSLAQDLVFVAVASAVLWEVSSRWKSRHVSILWDRGAGVVGQSRRLLDGALLARSAAMSKVSGEVALASSKSENRGLGHLAGPRRVGLMNSTRSSDGIRAGRRNGTREMNRVSHLEIVASLFEGGCAGGTGRSIG